MTEPGRLQRLPTHHRRLANGLTVIVREDHSAPVVAVVTHVKAGYFDEPDQLVGISHVLEHMYFKGTPRRGAGEIARETKAAGGYLNAGTIYDRTSYYTVLPAASLEQALDIQSDALQRSAIDDAELRRELRVIIQEANRKLDSPGAVARESLFETMFDVHRIRRWRIGTEAALEGFTRQDVWDYYRNLYRASNTILVIAGAVDPEHTFSLADRFYGDMPAGEPVRDGGGDEPERQGFRYRELSGDIIQTYIELGWRTPGTLHADTPALDVLAIVLGQGRASRLYRNVRDAGAVASISAYNYTPTTIGIFGIGAELNPPDIHAALEKTGAVLLDVLDSGFTEAEAERARNILEAQLVRRLETVEGQASLIADWEALGDWRMADDYLNDVMAVTPVRLHEVAHRYLQADALTLLLYRPREGPGLGAAAAAMPGAVPAHDDPEQTLSAQRARASLFAAEARPADRESAGIPTARFTAEDGIARAVPAIHAGGLRPQRVEDGVRFYTPDHGGASIVIKPRATTPLVSIALYCRGGVLAERNGSAGMTGLMARTSVKGTRIRSAARLAEETEALGASISPGVGADMIDWSISVPSGHFDRGLELLLDAALEPAFSRAEAERERKVALSDLDQLRDDMYGYPMRLAFSAAFPGHPYGFDIARIERAVRDAELTALPVWHRDRVLRGAPYLLVVGDVADPDAAAAAIAARLAGALVEPVGLDAPQTVWGPSGRRVEERDKAQTAIVLAFPGPPRNHPDLYALQLLSSAIAGLGGRLFEELRSRRSLAYAVSAAPLARWLGGAFIGYIGTAPEREAEARDALLAQLARSAAELLADDEIERARRYMIGAWQIRQQTHSRQLTDLAHALMIGEGLSELRMFEDRIRAITSEQVRAAAERWLDPAHLVEAVVRGAGASR